MAEKINVKLLLELRQANMSQRAIAASRHISTKSAAAVWKRADALGVSYDDVADKSDDEVLRGRSRYPKPTPAMIRAYAISISPNKDYVQYEAKAAVSPVCRSTLHGYQKQKVNYRKYTDKRAIRSLTFT